MNVPKIEAVDFGSNCRLGLCFLCLISFWFYVYVTLLFSACYHWWICLLVWLLSSIFITFYFIIFSLSSLFLSVYVYVSLCDLVSLVLLLPFGWGFYLFIFLFLFFVYFFFFFQAMWPAGFWGFSQMSGLSLQGGRAETKTLDHQRPPSHT